MTTQTKLPIEEHSLAAMLSEYETAIQTSYRSRCSRREAIKTARQALYRRYPNLVRQNLATNPQIASFWKRTQTIVRKYYNPVIELPQAAVLPQAAGLPQATALPEPAATTPTVAPNWTTSFITRYLDWITKHDWVPTDQFLLAFVPGLDQNTINKAAKAAINDGYRFEQIETGYRITTRPSAKDAEVASIKKQVAELNARLSALFQ